MSFLSYSEIMPYVLIRRAVPSIQVHDKILEWVLLEHNNLEWHIPTEQSITVLRRVHTQHYVNARLFAFTECMLLAVSL